MARSLRLPDWPMGAEVAVSLTFDVDSDRAWLGMHPDFDRRLSTLSQFRYGIVRGLPRVLQCLADRGMRATFYVPGATALAYPEAVREIAAAGHEVGHHGHDHLPPHTTDVELQRLEVERGLSALFETAGIRPAGYRAPVAELTPDTLELLLEHDFAYDSSCMGDDRPYVEERGDSTILELPLHWALDDAPYFLTTLDTGGAVRNPVEVLDIWMAEFRRAVAERRHVTYTMHPEIMGRGPQMTALERLIDEMAAEANVWFAAHEDVASIVRAANAGASTA
jgi:peptidoglycan-N-acetylglucosamine deacetylase